MNYQLMDCNDQIIIMISKDSYKIYLIAFNISYTICLNSIPNYVSSNVYKMMSKNIKHLSGSICDYPEFEVDGFIDNNCFYGSLITDIYDLSFEIPGIIDNNYNNKVLVYRNIDVMNPSIEVDEPINLIQNTKRIKTPKLGEVNMQNKYCGVTIDLHTSYISLYQSLDVAISSVISAIHYLNRAILLAKLAETPRILYNLLAIIFYLKEVNKASRLPIPYDDKIVNMTKIQSEYNKLLDKRKRDSCISSLFIGISGNRTLGVAYTSTIYFNVICNSLWSGSVVTKMSNKTIVSDISFRRSFTHEVGHQLGSQHDPEQLCTDVSDECPGGISDSECVGDDIVGRYIMYPAIDIRENKTQRMFSECSIRYIKKLINIEHNRFCFEAAPPTIEINNISQICGNGIIDPFEECDSGKTGDKCCTPDCHLTPGSQCSDYNEKCCQNCKISDKNIQCSNATECTFSSVCDGIDPECPPPEYKHSTQCDNKHGICSFGKCVNQICLIHNLKPREILQEELLCKVSCTFSNNYCFLFKSNYGLTFFNLQNSSCNNGNGICSENGKCMYTSIGGIRIGNYLNSL